MGNQTNADGKERRRHRRFSCSLGAEVVVRHSSMLFRGSVRDISRSGCFIESKARLKLARMQEVELPFSSRGIQVNSLARVMDIRPGMGAGFEFIAEDPRLEQPLLTLIGWLDGGRTRAEQPRGDHVGVRRSRYPPARPKRMSEDHAASGAGR